MVLADPRPRIAAPGGARPASPRARTRGDERIARGLWGRALLVLAALATALAALHVVLEGASWWFVGTGFAAAVLAAGAAARSVFRRRRWAPLVTAAVGVGLLTLGYAPDTALLGVIPTFDTLARWRTLIDSGIASIVEQRAPATPELGIVLLIAILLVGCAWFADLCLTLGAPAPIAIPLGGILVIPTAVEPGSTPLPIYFLVAAAYLAILRLGRRRDSVRASLVVGAAVISVSLVVPLVLPTVEEESVTPRAGLRTGVNPFITLGDDLRRGTPVLALSYTTTSQDPVYLRMTTLETFSGSSWGPRPADLTDGGDVSAFPAPLGLAADVPTREVTVDVDIAEVISRWLPTPYPTTAIEGLVGEWAWDPRGLAVRSAESSARGQEYTASFLEVDPTAQQLADAPSGAGGAGSAALALPGDRPPIIQATARDAAGAPGLTPYEQALALQSYLRSTAFEYSEETPVDEGFDGSGFDALAVFLERKSGYCVHYASAMAVMARELGIPSRIAVGFQPGARELVDGRAVYSVSSEDLHAWPELYFEGVGWLRFEPTPSRGAVPSYGTGVVDDPTTPEDESTVAPSAAPTSAPGARAEEDIPVDSAGVARSDDSAAMIALAVLGGVVLLALVPAAIRALVRASRVRRIRRGVAPADAAWEELRDTARDHGWTAPDAETARAFASRLEPALAESGRVSALRASVEAEAYGRGAEPDALLTELAAARRTIARASSWRTRLRVFLLPPSLMHRWRPE